MNLPSKMVQRSLTEQSGGWGGGGRGREGGGGAGL